MFDEIKHACCGTLGKTAEVSSGFVILEKRQTYPKFSDADRTSLDGYLTTGLMHVWATRPHPTSAHQPSVIRNLFLVGTWKHNSNLLVEIHITE